MNEDYLEKRLEALTAGYEYLCQQLTELQIAMSENLTPREAGSLLTRVSNIESKFGDLQETFTEFMREQKEVNRRQDEKLDNVLSILSMGKGITWLLKFLLVLGGAFAVLKSFFNSVPPSIK